MTEQQFDKLIHVLTEIAGKSYSITGATDWPLLLVLSGLVVGLLVYIWHDLKETIKTNRTEWREELNAEAKERERQDDLVWAEMRRCKEDCCPARKVAS